MLIDVSACFRWFRRTVPSGSGNGGKSSTAAGLINLFESRSISHTSSGNLKFRLNMKKLAGTPMMNGVGAKSNCDNKCSVRL